jgi:exodeoxyribonuclease-3
VRLECAALILGGNINDVNRRPSNLLSWLREAEPDVVCLQELKATGANLLREAIQGAGYHGV